MVRYQKIEGGVTFFFDYEVDRDNFVCAVEFLQEPIHDPDGPQATARLLEIRKRVSERDPYGAFDAGFLVRALRTELDQRINCDDEPRGFDL